MTTVDHVTAACGSLRTAWGWLAASTTPGRARRNQRHVSAQQAARHNQRAAEERAGKVVLVNAGTLVGGGQPPANLTALDARTLIADHVDQLAAELSLAVGVLSIGLIPVGVHYTRTSSADAKFTAALNWISGRAHLLTDPYLIDDAHQRLSDCDRLARAVVGEGPDRRRFASPCPCCGRRSLYWDTSSTEKTEWHVACSADTCRCQGVNCACAVPGRRPGMRHLWLSATWNTLARQLEENT